ncbi:MAG: hypothetical protein GYB49_16545 [Alphaproteobacteria bacterium]|nr:hypothetical protein [Hyphomonas sp.]MBR9808824.1 hypothetical protein [Alphaproteobacteria bacterium]|tara:strand:- start:409 stop:942 length:534 start_codon:yes stop_codon:yes gene_type:complete
MKQAANLLREHPAAIVVVGLVVSVLLLALWRSSYHARALQYVASLQSDVNMVLGRDGEDRASEPALQKVDPDAIQIFRDGISPQEAQSLTSPVCTYVQQPTFAARAEGTNICETTPDVARSGDIICLSQFTADTGEVASSDMSASYGCVLTIWSNSQDLWEIRDVVIGDFEEQSVMD